MLKFKVVVLLKETNDQNKMRTEQKTNYRSLSYGARALVVLVLSIGLMAIVYGGGIIPFDPFNLPAWVFGPLGVYTLVYSLIAGREPFYYLVWGSVMFAVAVASALYNIINVFIVFGMLMIVIAVIGFIAYGRKRR